MQYMSVCLQESNVAEWLLQDQNCIGKVIASTGFSGHEGEFEEWEMAGFVVLGAIYRDKA